MIDVDLLKRRQLTEMINAFEIGNLPMLNLGLFPDLSIEGDKVAWDIRHRRRSVGTLEGRGAPATDVQGQPMGQNTATLAQTFKSSRLEGHVLQNLRQPGTEAQKRTAQDELGDRMMELREIIDLNEEYMRVNALRGSITVTIDGISYTINMGIPTRNTATLAGGGDVYQIPTDWNDTGAAITRDVWRFKERVRTSSGYPLADAFCSDNIMEMMIRNDDVRSYFASTPAGGDFMKEHAVGRLFGINWHSYDAIYTDEDGNATRMLPANVVILVPKPDGRWSRNYVGSTVIPNDARNGFAEVPGLYGYSRIDDNPAGAILFAGKRYLPVLKRPGAVFVATPTSTV